MKVDVDKLIKWLDECIKSIDDDIVMDQGCKDEGRTPPFDEDNESWLISIKGRKDGFESVKAHLECGLLNKAYHLCKGIDDDIEV